MLEPFRSMGSSGDASLLYLTGWMRQQQGLTAGMTTRRQGNSRAPWSSLNMGLHVGDEPEDVVRNRQQVASLLGWPFDSWTCAEQVHGARVYRVGRQDRGRGRLSMEDAIKDCDALMTDEAGILLTSFYADCVPLYFYDPHSKAIALAHAGWKGTLQRIAQAVIEAMGQAYGSSPHRLLAAIGPSIGACCYEVDEPVISKVSPLLEELTASPNLGTRDEMMQSDGNKARLNLKEINRQIMIKAGILPTHIELTGRCTGCDTETFFSHRVEKGRTGRMATWIGMEKR